jgi:hypothetical protein
LGDLKARNQPIKEVIMFEGKLGKSIMIQQGYVPPTCTLPDEFAGMLIYAEIQKGKSPCDGCLEDRAICKGKPRSE